jgi:hypothetical protein
MIIASAEMMDMSIANGLGENFCLTFSGTKSARMKMLWSTVVTPDWDMNAITKNKEDYKNINLDVKI